MALEDILTTYFGLPAEHTDAQWREAYQKMTECLGDIGLITECDDAMSNIIDVLDEIDSEAGEI